MNLRIIVNGIPQWQDAGPANGTAGPGGYRGSLVQGEPGWRERDRLAARTRKSISVAAIKAGLKAAPDDAALAARLEVRRSTFREAKRRARARAKCDNGYGSSSAQSHRLPNDARDSATTRGAGVVAPIEVVAR